MEEEIITDILSWLPVKSLIRFRSVAKPWSALTRNPNFALHRTRSPTPTKILLNCAHSVTGQNILTANNPNREGPDPEKVLEYHSFFRFETCNNLVSIHPHPLEPRLSTMILNPSTRQTLSLPFNAASFRDFASVSNHFGLDPVSKQYKLMLLGTWSLDLQGRYRCEIITLGTSHKKWRRVLVGVGAPAPFGSSTCFNGAIHWMVCPRYQQLLVFDLSSEKFRTIPAPGSERRYSHICQVFGYLALAEELVDGVLRLWMLKEDVWDETIILLSVPDTPCVVGNISTRMRF